MQEGKCNLDEEAPINLVGGWTQEEKAWRRREEDGGDHLRGERRGKNRVTAPLRYSYFFFLP